MAEGRRREDNTPAAPAARRRKPIALEIALAANRNAPNPALDDDDSVPDDIEAFRLGLIRRIASIVQDWRRCGEPSCLRAKRCVSPRLACAQIRKGPKPTPDQLARSLASLQRMLQQRLAECAEQNESAGAAPPAKAARR